MIRNLNIAISKFVDLFKWPIAIVAILALPALIESLEYLNITNIKFYAFVGGCGVYIALKLFASARSSVYMQTIAHEFTHAFFAILTLNRVTKIRIYWDETGGVMSFKGRGNWLVIIAPYFFPLFLFFIALGLTFFNDSLPSGITINVFLGYFFAYHVESIISQIHPKQTDFIKVGFPFCFLFLPGANLFVCSMVLAFNNGGWINVQKYVIAVYKIFMIDAQNLYNYLVG